MHEVRSNCARVRLAHVSPLSPSNQYPCYTGPFAILWPTGACATFNLMAHRGLVHFESYGPPGPGPFWILWPSGAWFILDLMALRGLAHFGSYGPPGPGSFWILWPSGAWLIFDLMALRGLAILHCFYNDFQCFLNLMALRGLVHFESYGPPGPGPF